MSGVWQFFKKDNVSLKVICVLCKKQYVNPGSSTTNMWNHLKHKHNSKFIELNRIRMGLSKSVPDQGGSLDEDEQVKYYEHF